MTAFDDLVDGVRAALHARRRERLKGAEAVAEALEAYRIAVEAEVAAAYAEAHGLSAVKTKKSAGDAARALLQAVQRLPEVGDEATSSAAPKGASSAAPKGASSASSAKDARALTTRAAASGAMPPLPKAAVKASSPASRGVQLPRLEAAVTSSPLVVVGGVIRRERLAELPELVRAGIEWIDTTSNGTHAIGNLEKRIKDHRLCALVVLEGIVSHKHSDPLVSACRGAGLPYAYGGRGGKSAIEAALKTLEAMV